MSVLSALLEPQGWPISAYLVLTTILGYFFVDLLSKPAFPSKSPALLKGYPIVGVPMLFSARRALFTVGTALSKTGHFSFYFGKLQIVAVTGQLARKFYFENKDLDMTKGYEKLFAVSPKVELDPSLDEDFPTWFIRNVKKMVGRDKFVNNLGTLSGDVHEGFETLLSRQNKVMNPYVDLYRMVYQLTMRTVGCEEIAESKELGDKTLALFESCEDTASPARLIIPWLPTFGHIKRMLVGGKLYMILDKIIKDRERTGTVRNDALQMLIDQKSDVTMIIQFIMGALFAGQINSGINAAAMMVNLTKNPEWMTKLQQEVDGVVAKYRCRKDESPMDILSHLDLDVWEAEFPLVEMALRETIRLEMVGSAFRQNISDRPLKISGTDEEIPSGAYSMYLIDDVHMNPAIYTEPEKWDPSRFLPEREEDKKQPHAFIGWGVGRHPCAGMRFAKLEMNLIAAYFIARFNFQLSDQHGNLATDPPAPKSRSRFSAHKPDVPVYLRYQPRY